MVLTAKKRNRLVLGVLGALIILLALTLFFTWYTSRDAVPGRETLTDEELLRRMGAREGTALPHVDLEAARENLNAK